jgi:predicted amidohydrolase
VRELARRRGIDVVVGFAERAPDGRLHNTLAYVGRDGAIVFTYRKVHCRRFEWTDGEGAFTPGDGFQAVDRAWGERRFRIGAMICFDREIPETNRCLRALGAELVVCPLATDTSRLDCWHERSENESITRTRAAENEQFIVVVNHAGRFNGGSFAVGPYGEPWCQLGAEAEVRTIALPVGAVPRKFHADPWGWMGWGYRRPEVYAKYLGQSAAARA